MGCLTTVCAEPAGRDVQGQGVSQRPPGPQIKHPVRVMPSAPSVLVFGTRRGGGARPPSGSFWVRPSGGVEAEGHSGAVIDAHTGYGAHRAAA